MILNDGNFTALYRGFKTNFNQGMLQGAKTAQWSKVATRVPSSTQIEDYGWLEDWPMFREWIGPRQIKSLRTQQYTLANQDWEDTVGVPKNDIDDDRYGIYGPMMSGMGYAASVHPDNLVFSLLAAAKTTLCYDGQYFCDTDHPVLTDTASPTTASNSDTTGSTALWFLMDTTKPLKPLIYQVRQEIAFQALNRPTDWNVFTEKQLIFGGDGRMTAGVGFWQMIYASVNAINQTNFRAYRLAMRSLRSNHGVPLNINPNLLVCGPSGEDAARDMLAKDFLSGGERNVEFNTVQILVVPWLT